MDDIVAQAHELGSSISESDECRRYLRLSKSVNRDSERKQVLDRYMELVATIQESLPDNAVPLECKEEYEMLAVKINNDQEILDFMDAQKQYVELIDNCVRIITDL